MAVWVQGPGTVWVDDWSLREVIPAPLTLSLDQGEYDTLDKAATGVFTVNGRIRPAQVRVSLGSPNRGVVEDMIVPCLPQWAKKSDSALLTLMAPADLSQSRFVFNSSVLAPGLYECRVTLLDAEQRERAKRSVAFERTPDAR